jgi:alpha-tubulin suppressor-like RCC1 family protein
MLASAPAALEFWQINSQWDYTCGVTTDWRVYCWGWDGREQHLTPAAVVTDQSFRQVSAGGTHACGVTVGHLLYCWGSNSVGQLGDGTNTPHASPMPVASGLQFAQVEAGHFHTCALSYPERRAYCWGANAFGQLGDGTAGDRLTPVAVLGAPRFRQLSAGESHTCGVTGALQALCWGRNQYGQLGDSTTTTRLTLVPVAGRNQFRQVDAGWTFTCAVTTDERAFCWGQGSYGQLGDGRTGRRLWPKPVAGGLQVDRVTAGRRHACAETTGNLAYCWGQNQGALGVGSFSGPEECRFDNCSTTPVAVVGGLRFRQLTTSQARTCGKTSANLAFCWGSGALGNGTVGGSPAPTPVSGPAE